MYFRAVCRMRGYRVYHEPNHVPMRFAGPTVTTIHDLSVLRFPHWHPTDRVRWYEAGFHRALDQTSQFIAVSEFTKGEMADLLGIDPQRISVIHNAPREIFSPAAPDEYVPLLERFGIRRPFLLFVGTLEPRKNFDTLLTAFASLPAQVRECHQLVLAGGIGWGDALHRDDPRARAVDLRLVGYVDDDQLRLLYSSCLAFVWPSLYEGFGLPPLECMACGRPVITSNAASLPEVVADAAITVDPQDPAALAAAMARLVEDADATPTSPTASPAPAAPAPPSSAGAEPPNNTPPFSDRPPDNPDRTRNRILQISRNAAALSLSRDC
jgi:alpha-1,3-rhamnosyl/mannosyltransferase